MMDANYLRERAAHYRHLAESEDHADAAEAYRRVATAFEAEAREIDALSAVSGNKPRVEPAES